MKLRIVASIPPSLKSHSMWSLEDYNYLKGKGYTDEEIKGLWDRDASEGKDPVNHPEIPDVVGLISDPDFHRSKK